jgi:hypothetical protein
VIFAVDLNEAAVGDETRQQTPLLNRHRRVAFGMDNEHGTFDFKGGISHIRIPTDHGGVCAWPRLHDVLEGLHLLGIFPGMAMDHSHFRFANLATQELTWKPA